MQDGGALAETRRRIRYEWLYAEWRAARREYLEARARGADRHQLRRARERLQARWHQLAAWRRRDKPATSVSPPEEAS
ncbi:MAG: hypothetical protein AVDCRST_MAG77-3508 [uncultured Chloroflexi bacterium]|uniref:Uncharacterized protein n=1 Tax=uncultured Chloroflexota bacterium TaxID=166587 RepID=A0A6J4JBA2_9CHLR|nr:MAG: hypothetical protein AVDCRST_MAG77-3508 [uncultured Chloroflexota bacterium]